MPVPDKPADQYDVVVLGSGLAGTAAALAAWEDGASVLVADKAPRESAGGNTRFSGGGFRIPRGDFTPDNFFEDLMIVTRGRGNKELLRNMTVRAKEDTDWLQTHGLRFGDQTQFTHVGPRRVAALWAEPVPFDIDGATQIGCGNGVVVQLHKGLMEKVDVVFDTKGERLLVDEHRQIVGVRIFHPDRGFQDVAASAVIMATGGFQANQEMRARYFGSNEAAHWPVRGTRFNQGDGIKMAVDIGAAAIGNFADIHCAVIDARTQAVEGGETNVNTYPFAIIVNNAGERFVDEGEDFRDRTYAKFGKSILAQPGSIAHVVYDHKVSHLIGCYVREWGPTSADSLDGLAAKVGIDPAGLRQTVEAFNAAVDRSTPFDSTGKDGRAARGIRPEKSNWAVELDTAPYHAYTVTGGITFTFGGLRTNVDAEVLSTEGQTIPGLYAAGEIQGDFFYYNYPGGSSLIRASVYGRAAGTHAAAFARSKVTAHA
jgi:tricarballylate dehydrogenase